VEWPSQNAGLRVLSVIDVVPVEPSEKARPASPLRQFHESTEGGLEATSVDVEGPKVFVEANVQELTSSGLHSVTGGVNHTATDASVPVVGVDHDIFDERMNEAVPQHVDEADEAVSVSCHDPTEAVSLGLGDPVPFGLVEQPRREGGCVQCVISRFVNGSRHAKLILPWGMNSP
jgi:hypothetical protein